MEVEGGATRARERRDVFDARVLGAVFAEDLQGRLEEFPLRAFPLDLPLVAHGGARKPGSLTRVNDRCQRVGHPPYRASRRRTRSRNETATRTISSR